MSRPALWQSTARLAFLILALTGASWAGESHCDPGVRLSPETPNGYRDREDRCEGLFAHDVAGSTTLLVASLTASVAAFDPRKDGTLNVAWSAPDNARATRLRAFGLRRKQYYRMDTTRPAGEKVFHWPADVLANLNLTPNFLGVVAWSTIVVAGSKREVYLPLRIGPDNTGASRKRNDLLLVPGAELAEVYTTLERLDPRTSEKTIAYEKRPLKYGFYPAERPVTIPVEGLGEPGYYLFTIAATLKYGGSATTEICFYHSLQ